MEEEIKAEFERVGFSLDYEEKLLKNVRIALQSGRSIISIECSHGEEMNIRTWFTKGDPHLYIYSSNNVNIVEHSGGQRVLLDLQEVTHFSFFPGLSNEVVGVEGHNPSGHCLVASKVIDTMPLLTPPDMGLPPANKQAPGQEFHPNSPYAMLCGAIIGM